MHAFYRGGLAVLLACASACTSSDESAGEKKGASSEAAGDASPSTAAPTASHTGPESEPVVDEAGEVRDEMLLAPEVEILRMVLARDVVDRTPVGTEQPFAVGDRVNIYMEVRNESGADTTMQACWENKATGKRTPQIEVNLPVSKKYKTRAYHTMRTAGTYRAVLTGTDGSEWTSAWFDVE